MSDAKSALDEGAKCGQGKMTDDGCDYAKATSKPLFLTKLYKNIEQEPSFQTTLIPSTVELNYGGELGI